MPSGTRLASRPAASRVSCRVPPWSCCFALFVKTLKCLGVEAIFVGIAVGIQFKPQPRRVRAFRCRRIGFLAVSVDQDSRVPADVLIRIMNEKRDVGILGSEQIKDWFRRSPR